MENFLRFCSIVSIIIAAIKLALIGLLTPGTIAFILISSLLILAGNRKIYIVAAAASALVLFVKCYGGGTSRGETTLLQSLLILSTMVFGIYLMIKCLLPSQNNGKKRN